MTKCWPQLARVTERAMQLNSYLAQPSPCGAALRCTALLTYKENAGSAAIPCCQRSLSMLGARASRTMAVQ